MVNYWCLKPIHPNILFLFCSYSNNIKKCHRIFQTPTGLRHHMLSHTGDYKYTCEFCGKGFAAKARSEEHRASHTKEKRYTCEICGIKFSVQVHISIKALDSGINFPISRRLIGSTGNGTTIRNRTNAGSAACISSTLLSFRSTNGNTRASDPTLAPTASKLSQWATAWNVTCLSIPARFPIRAIPAIWGFLLGTNTHSTWAG